MDNRLEDQWDTGHPDMTFQAIIRDFLVASVVHLLQMDPLGLPVGCVDTTHPERPRQLPRVVGGGLACDHIPSLGGCAIGRSPLGQHKCHHQG